MPNWMDVLLGWWISLFQGDWEISGTVVGVALGLVIAAFAVLIAGTAVIWALVAVKWLGRTFAVGFMSKWSRSDAEQSAATNR